MSIPAIGLVRLGALGDVVRLLPLAGPAKRRFGARRLVWVTGSGIAPLVRAHPEVDEVVELPPPGLGTLGAWITGLIRVRRSRLTLCLDLQGLAKSGLLTWGSGAPLRLGLARDRAREGSAWAVHMLLPRRIRSRYEEGLERLGLGWDDWRQGASQLRRAWGLDSEPRRGVLIHPGGSRRNRYKRWPAERYIEAARLLWNRTGQRILVHHGPGERALAEAIAAEAPEAQVASSKDLLGLARDLGRAALFIGGDSGPLHLALLAGTPTIAVYGPSDPILYALPPCTPHRVVRSDLPCAPCIHRACRSVECLERLAAAEVAAAAVELLERGS